MEPLCKSLINLLCIENTNDERIKIETKLDSVGKVFAELMDVLEKKNIVNFNPKLTYLNKAKFEFDILLK